MKTRDLVGEFIREIMSRRRYLELAKRRSEPHGIELEDFGGNVVVAEIDWRAETISICDDLDLDEDEVVLTLDEFLESCRKHLESEG